MKSVSDFTYRVDVLTPTPEAIAARNAAEGRQGPTAFALDVAATCATIATTPTATAAQLETWIWHPDERVPIALCARLRDLQVSDTDRADGAVLGGALFQRAITEANVEGASWTPLLDAIATAGRWPSNGDVAEAFRALPRPTGVAPSSAVRPMLIVDRFGALGGSVSQRHLVESLDEPTFTELLRFHVTPLRTVLARLGVHWDLGRIADVLGRSPELIYAFGTNTTLEPLTREWLRDEAWRLYESRTVPSAHLALTALARDGVPLTAAHAPAMRAVLERELAALVANPAHLPQQGAVSVALSLIRENEPLRDALDTATLHWIADTMHDLRWGSALMVLMAANADRALWLKALNRPHSAETRLCISRVRAARQDPEIRAILARSTKPEVLVNVLLAAEGAEFLRTYRKLIARSPGPLVWVLEQRAAAGELGALLTRSDLTPLIAHADGELNLRIMALLPHVRGASRPSSRTRGPSGGGRRTP